MRRLSPNIALLASAFVLAGLIIVAAGAFDRPARADLVSSISGVTALTVESQNEDVLLVIDGRSEHLLAYKVVSQNSLQLFGTYDLPRLFSEAHNRASGRLPPK